MEYKIGDKVRIRRDLKTRDMDVENKLCSISDSMASHKGEVMTITNIIKWGDWEVEYHLDNIDGGWTSDMFEKFESCELCEKIKRAIEKGKGYIELGEAPYTSLGIEFVDNKLCLYASGDFHAIYPLKCCPDCGEKLI